MSLLKKIVISLTFVFLISSMMLGIISVASITQLKEKNKQLTDIINTQNETINTQQEQIKQEETNTSKISDDLKTQTDKVNSLESINSEQNKTINAAKEEIDNLKNNNTKQNEEINTLKDLVSSLELEVAKLKNVVDWSDTEYNYLAIGNSLTIHSKCDYWWNEIGMAASRSENDYVHIVADEITTREGSCCFHAVNFANWETMSNDRAEAYPTIYPYLSDKVDLITLQFGENVGDTTSYVEDYLELIDFVTENAPNAEIVILDDFWHEDIGELNHQAAIAKSLKFVSYGGIQGQDEYRSSIGSVVYDDMDNPHIIEKVGVATHPSDVGMAYIASKVIEVLYE